VDPPVQRVVAHDTTAAERGAPCGLERWAVERTCLGPEVADGTKDLRLFSALAPTKDAVARMPVKDAIAWAIFAEVRRNLKLFLFLRLFEVGCCWRMREGWLAPGAQVSTYRYQVK
jgi:hypothetical protein